VAASTPRPPTPPWFELKRLWDELPGHMRVTTDDEVLRQVSSLPPQALRATTQTTVRYPARGTRTLWEAGTGRCPAARFACSAVAGRLLEVLRSPSTVTDLARELRVSPSAIPQHLRVLRDSGLVAGERSGRVTSPPNAVWLCWILTPDSILSRQAERF
jgi:DNA-binding transcriptional ArsR family regulator